MNEELLEKLLELIDAKIEAEITKSQGLDANGEYRRVDRIHGELIILNKRIMAPTQRLGPQRNNG